MRKFLLSFYVLLITVLANAQNYNVINYNFNGTPTNGVKIKTNLPYANNSQMPTVIIQGYNYGTGKPISINLVWYIYNGEFYNYGATSSGAYTPEIMLANENGYVVIFINDRSYYQRFSVRVFAQGMSEVPSWFVGWTIADEVITGTNTVTVPYYGPITTSEGNVGIGMNGLSQYKIAVNGKGNFYGAISSFNVSVGQNDVMSSTKNYVNFSTNNHGTALMSSNLYCVDNDNLIIANTHPSMSGAAILIPGNSRAHQNSILFYTNALQAVTADNPYNGKLAMKISDQGNVSIATDDAKGYKLAVNGSAIFTKAVVKNYANWPDYVFDSSYQLPSLDSVSTFIQTNKHLPDMPSAATVEKDGHDLGEVQKLLLKKMEEMTLYIIELKKNDEAQKKENELLRKEMESLKKIICL